MATIWQEFYCGECQGYFTAKLNMALNHIVWIVCPNCKHEHKRCIHDGRIEENGRENGRVIEHICPTLSSYSKEPLTKKMHKEKCTSWGKRDGVVIKDEKDLVRDAFMSELWFEHFGGGHSTALDD